MGEQGEMFPVRRDSPKLVELGKLLERALQRATKDITDSTKRTYLETFRAWAGWCERFGKDPSIPINPETFLTWLEWQAENGLERGTIQLRMHALSAIDTRERTGPTGLGPEVKLCQHNIIRRWWRAYCLDHPVNRLNQAPAISVDELSRVIEHLYSEPLTPARKVRRARDRALLLLGYTGAFRRGELSRCKVGNIETHPRGLVIHWDRSKTDPEGLGHSRLVLPQADAMLCPVDAWREWIDIYTAAGRWQDAPPISDDRHAFPGLRGPLIKATGLTEQVIYQRIVAIGQAAGVRITPHSLRAALATHAAYDHDEGDIAHHGRWTSRRTLERYIRRGKMDDPRQKNVTAGLTNRKRTTKGEET